MSNMSGAFTYIHHTHARTHTVHYDSEKRTNKKNNTLTNRLRICVCHFIWCVYRVQCTLNRCIEYHCVAQYIALSFKARQCFNWVFHSLYFNKTTTKKKHILLSFHIAYCGYFWMAKEGSIFSECSAYALHFFCPYTTRMDHPGWSMLSWKWVM